MDWATLLSHINWKTTAWGIGYGICRISGMIWPNVAEVCQLFETATVMGIATSGADSSRLQSIVRAVDHLFAKDGVDPTTMAPVVPAPAKVS